MAVAAPNPGNIWNDLLSTTAANHRKSLTDNVFNGRPLLHYLMSNGRVRVIDGGHSIVEPIMINEGDSDSYSEWDQIEVVPVETATAAQFPWKQLYATIAISGLEEAQNNGKEMIINLLEAKIQQAEETLKTKLNGMLFGTRAGTVPAKDFTSLIELVDDVLPAGGITPTAPDTYWKSVVKDGSLITDAASFEAALSAAFNDSSDSGGDHVDAIFTTAAIFGFYESGLTPQVRYTDTTKANLGFQNLMYKNIPIYWDFQAPTGVILGLNSKYVGLVLHKDRNFKQSPFTDNLSGTVGSMQLGAAGTPAANTIDARISFITTYGNTTIRNRRRQFKITGVPTPA